MVHRSLLVLTFPPISLPPLILKTFKLYENNKSQKYAKYAMREGCKLSTVLGRRNLSCGPNSNTRLSSP